MAQIFVYFLNFSLLLLFKFDFVVVGAHGLFDLVNFMFIENYFMG